MLDWPKVDYVTIYYMCTIIHYIVIPNYTIITKNTTATLFVRTAAN